MPFSQTKCALLLAIALPAWLHPGHVLFGAAIGAFVVLLLWARSLRIAEEANRARLRAAQEHRETLVRLQARARETQVSDFAARHLGRVRPFGIGDE